MDDIGRGSLTVFRLPALLAATGVSLLTGLTARELGGGPFAQGLATLTAAAGTFVLVSGHLLATSTIDWQASHGWPQLTLAGQIRDEYGTLGARAVFAAQQLVLFSIGATVLGVIGLVRVWRDPERSGLRMLGWSSVVVLGVFAVTAGQGYYPGGIYPALIAAGAVTVEGYRRLRARPRWALVGTVAATSALLVPAALPVLPPATLGSTVWAGIGEQQREMVGWPHLVDLVGQAYRSIPAQQRSRAGIFTANYGEAGAVDRFGPALGLPRAWSGHHGYGLWGPPPSDVSPVVVVWEDGPPDGRFTGCRRTARVTAPVSNEESDRASVYVCDGPVDGWAAAWPGLAHLSS